MTPKQQRFVQEYLIDLNATQAAIRAGYSAKSAKLQGHRMITDDNVQKAIRAKQAKLIERTEITLERITEMLQEDRDLARQLKQMGPATTAAMGLAKLHGLITDKVENTHRHVSRGERRSRISELLERQGAGGVARAPGARARGNGTGKPH